MPSQQWVGDALASANATADWRGIRTIYEQIMYSWPAGSTRESPSILRDLRDTLAEYLTAVAVSYVGREHDFVTHALAVIAGVHGQEWLDPKLFREHYLGVHLGLSSSGDLTQRFPTPFETIVETSRRMLAARALQEALAGQGTMGILCGSTSYAPFYKVHGFNRQGGASDLDLLIIVNDSQDLIALVERLSGLAGLSRPAIKRLYDRIAVFREHYDNGQTVLSHKLPMWQGQQDPVLDGTELRCEYKISLHFLTRRTFGYVLVEWSTTLDRAFVGGRGTVTDYRNTRTQRSDRVRTFAGREHTVPATVTSVNLGFLRPMTAYQFDDADCYCPGFLQTNLLPVFGVLWDERGWGASLKTFAAKFFNRYRSEVARSSDAHLRPSFTHVRNDDFAPHITRDFDRGSAR